MTKPSSPSLHSAMAKESKTVLDRRARVAHVLPLLRQAYPDAKCSLDFSNPLELLVATILSAQCTDLRVNIVTKELFKRLKTPADYAAIPQAELEKLIQSTGFYRNKAKSIIAMAKELLAAHGGQVPRTMDELHRLPGVGRKTANVVLGNAFGIDVGVTVDTHVTRLANRLHLTKHKSDAVKIEQDLIATVPQSDWTIWSHLLIHHGRAICEARKPRCADCILRPYCPSAEKLIAAATKSAASARKKSK